MLLILPPSETKRDGGEPESRLALATLSFPELTPARRATLAGLRELSRSVSASMSALKLGATQRDEIDRNRAVTRSPVLSALDRYTGVLYDALDVVSLEPPARAWADDHVVVHSALFGLLRGADRIPAYRLSHDSRLPNGSLRAVWRAPIASSLAASGRFVLDLRSEGYAALGPAPEGSRYLRVVSEDSAGRRSALSHFNKKSKGEFTRALAEAHPTIAGESDLLRWAAGAGWRLEPGAPGELDLVVTV